MTKAEKAAEKVERDAVKAKAKAEKEAAKLQAKADKDAAKATKKAGEEPRLKSDAGSGEEAGAVAASASAGASDPVDYLRKYQVRKQTKPGSVESDPPAGSKAETMKKFLLSQPRIRMLIPRPQGEAPSIDQSVCLNGYRLDFPKDAYVDVPEAVADVLGESLKQTNVAIQRHRIDGNKEKENALL